MARVGRSGGICRSPFRGKSSLHEDRWRVSRRTYAAAAVALLLVAVGTSPALAESLEVASPSGVNSLRLDVAEDVRISISRRGTMVLQPSAVAMTVSGPRVLGQKPQIVGRVRSDRDETFASVMYAKRQRIRDHYHQLEVTFDGGYGLILRAYDDGVAFRWKTTLPGELTVQSEQMALRFAGNPSSYLQIARRADNAPADAPDGFHFNY